MSDSNNPLCAWLHESLGGLPLISYPFELSDLPANGIYFFHEEGETWGHGGSVPRIVRVGTHRQGNFADRIGEHFVLNERRMNFDASKPRPHDRSIFRKHLGAAMLNRERNSYLPTWSKNLMKSVDRAAVLNDRDIVLEKAVEVKVTNLIRRAFSFHFITLEDERLRIGREGLERALVGTLAGCDQCKSSANWLGLSSPNHHIRDKGLWQVHYLTAPGLTDAQKSVFLAALAKVPGVM